jgi:hypothetical protein
MLVSDTQTSATGAEQDCFIIPLVLMTRQILLAIDSDPKGVASAFIDLAVELSI